MSVRRLRCLSTQPSSLLEDPSKIPVRILVGAMRIATKYLMEKEQAAIVRVILARGRISGIGGHIPILCFIAEFPEHFKKVAVLWVFKIACSTVYYPSAEHLKLLMDYPQLLVAMMKYREGQLNPERAVWNAKPTPISWPVRPPTEEAITPMDEWVNDQLNSLGLCK